MLGRIESAFRAREESEAEAKASEERMRRFVADASHELRTPLTSIRGFAELYRQGAVPDPADIGRVMRRIEDQATRMGLLVEDLLLLARLDQQRPLDLQPVDLLTIASEAVQDAQALDPDRTVSLVVDPEGPPPVVLGDETRLRQVVGNLMSNALTHTPTGTPVTVALGTDGRVRPAGRRPTTVRACQRTTRRTCSSASTAPTPPGPAPAVGPGWACRSRPRSSPRTPARSACRPPPATVPRSPCASR